jgi:hypothetical protein
MQKPDKNDGDEMANYRYDYEKFITEIESKFKNELDRGEHITIKETESVQFLGKSIKNANVGHCILEKGEKPEGTHPTIPCHLGKEGYSSRLLCEEGKKYLEVWRPLLVRSSTTQAAVENRRLLYAKMLFNHGYEHSTSGTGIGRMIAVHNFHNAIEIILKSIAIKYGIHTRKNIDLRFKDLWNEINMLLSSRCENAELPFKDPIFGLCELRNRVQHHGDEPSERDTQKYSYYAENFIRHVLKDFFEMDYDCLFISSLIEDEKIRDEVMEAEKALERRDFRKCIELCNEALESTINNVFHPAGWMAAYFGFEREFFDIVDGRIPEKYKDRDFHEFAEEICKAILQLGQASTSMQFLGDYRMDFLKHRQIFESMEFLSDKKLEESARFSMNFVINIILKWQEDGIFTFTTNYPISVRVPS